MIFIKERKDLILNLLMVGCVICFFISVYSNFGWSGIVVALDILGDILQVLAASQ